MILQSENVGDLKNGYFCIFPANSKIRFENKDDEEEKDHDEEDDEDEGIDENGESLEERFFGKHTNKIIATYSYK